MNKERFEIRLVIPATVFLCFFLWSDRITDRKLTNLVIDRLSEFDKGSSSWLTVGLGLTGITISLGFVISVIFSLVFRPLLGNELQRMPFSEFTPASTQTEINQIENLNSEVFNFTENLEQTTPAIEWWWNDDKSRVSIYRVAALPAEIRAWIERRSHIFWICGSTATGLTMLLIFEAFYGGLTNRSTLGCNGALWVLACLSMIVVFFSNTVLTLNEIQRLTGYCAARDIRIGRPSRNRESTGTKPAC